MYRKALIVAFALGFAVSTVAICNVGWAQEGEQPGSPAEMESPSRTVPVTHRSARATMETFLGAFYDESGPDLETAAGCLDLSDLSPAVRSLRGHELAGQLKQVIDRTRLVELESIPDEAVGPPWVFERYEEGAIIIAPTDDGRWLFSRDTVRDLWEIRTEVGDQAIVEGIGQAYEVVTPAMWIRAHVPESWRFRLLTLEAWQWLGILVVILLGVVIGRAFTAVVASAFERALARRRRQVDRKLLAAAIQPASVFLMVVLWGVGALWLGLPTLVFKIWVEAIVVVAVIAFTLFVYRLMDVGSAIFERRAEESEGRLDDLLVPLIRKSLKVLIVAIGFVTVAGSVGIEIAGLLAGLGLGGLAFALAAQDTVSNLFGSVTVLFDQPFQVGDWVKVGDVEGTVEEMGFRSTRIRTFYNSLITLPNSNLIKASVDNYGARRFRRWSTRLGIAYNTPPETVDAFCEGVRELIRRHPYTRKDYYHVYFNQFGAANLEILLYMFFDTPDWSTELRERHRLAVDILRLAHELGVEFAFPTQTVYLREEPWSPPETAGAGYPEASRMQLEAARQAAGRIVDDALAGEVPPPVEFEVPPVQDGGDAGE
jgi:MscS family membrane protein